MAFAVTADGEKVTLIPEVKQAWDAFAQADLLALMGCEALQGYAFANSINAG